MTKQPVRAIALAAARIAQAGDAIEIHGDPNPFGGRPVVARIVYDGTRFAAYRADGTPLRRGDLATVLAEFDADFADRGDWSFADAVG